MNDIPALSSENKQKNIGKNIVLNCCKKKHVIGIEESTKVVIACTTLVILIYSLWAGFLFHYVHLSIFIIVTVLFLFTITNYLLCFFKDPGIIPRNSILYPLDEKDNENKDTNELNNNEQEKKDKENHPININENSTEKIEIQNKNSKDDKDNNIENTNNINKEEENNKDNGKTKEETKIDPIPRIFTSRKCKTCSISRPPTASHCSECDNCVLNFDHHCFYISNCVGERNHKNFFLFIFLGTITSLFIFVTSIIHFIYVMFFYENNISKEIVTDHVVIFSIAMGLIVIGLLLIVCGINIFFSIPPVVIGIIGFFVLFYVTKHNYPYNYKKYYNPFSLLILFGAGYFCGQCSAALGAQFFVISKGLTIKQNESIKQKIRELESNNLHIDDKYKFDFQWSKFLCNIFSFLFRKTQKSLINVNTDI